MSTFYGLSRLVLQGITMLRTQVFDDGSSYQTTSYGSISVKYHGDKARITIKYLKSNLKAPLLENSYRESRSTLQVYTLNQLKLDPFFREKFDRSETLKYFHTWKLRLKGNQLIVYSGENELAFKLKAHGGQDIIDDLKSIISADFCSSLTFFSEMRWNATAIKYWQMSIDQIKKLPNIDEKTLNLIFNRMSDISILVDRGISLRLLLAIDHDKMINLIASADQLDMILKYVTINQILGIDHQPPVSPRLKHKRSDHIKFSNLFESGKSGLFSYEHNESGLTITYNNSKCEYEYIKPTDDVFSQFNRTSNHLNTSNYLHQWVELAFQTNEQKEGNIISHLYYSPELRLYINERYDPSFPLDEVKKYHFHILVYVPMCYEEIVEKDLNKNNYSFEKARLLNGMTDEKLDVLTANYSNTKKLFKFGLTMEDLAKCDEDRLMMAVTNFDDVEKVLEFVDIKEILGLKAHLPALKLSANKKYSPTLFAQSSVKSHTEEADDISDDNDSDSKINNDNDSDSDDDSDSDYENRKKCIIS